MMLASHSACLNTLSYNGQPFGPCLVTTMPVLPRSPLYFEFVSDVTTGAPGRSINRQVLEPRTHTVSLKRHAIVSL